MRDEIDSRLWVAHHADFADFLDQAIGGLKEAFDSVRTGLRRANQFEFDAPWRRSTAGCR